MTPMPLKKDIAKATPVWLCSLRRFWLSPLFFGLVLAVGLVCTALSREVAGAMAMVWLILIILVTSDDAFAATVPFLLLTVLVSACYDGYALFIPYVWMIVPAVLALVFHFIYYRGQYSIGASFAPLVAVSVAVTLGGVGCLRAEEYFTPATLYYVLGLGFGMVAVYLLLRSALSRKRAYDVRQLLLTGLYLVGIYATFFTLLFYAERLVWMQDDLAIFGHLRLISIDNRNVYATFLLLALPAPFYHAAKGRGWHLFPALFFYAALLLTGSRGGMVMGTVLFLLCFLYLLRRDETHRRRNLLLLSILALLAIAAGGFLLKFYSFRFEGGFIKGDEPRVRLLGRAVKDFIYHPIFGVGLGYTGNADIYNPKTFAMNWYHMMIPQIVAGLGLVGTFAYLFLFWRRAMAMKQASNALSRALSLSYIGLFLMSQVNPGEFCPFPYELIAVMIFLFLENEAEAAKRQKAAQSEAALEALLSHALFKTPLALPESTDFAAVLELAKQHMVFGIVSEALGTLPEDALPNEILLDLQDSTVTLLRQNGRLARCRTHLCDFFAEQGIPAVILKGDSVAALYPTPQLRVAGDIDCLLYEADLPQVADFLRAHGFKPADKEGEHHVAFEKSGCVIELHRTVSGLPSGGVGDRLRACLSDTLEAATLTTLEGEQFPVPDSFHQALILLLHMQQHMREGGLGLRQVCDWALFVAKELKKEETPRLLAALQELGLYRFAEAVTVGAVRHLGLPPERCPFAGDDALLSDALFADFMASGNFGSGNAAYAGSGVVTLRRTPGKGALATAISGVAQKCKEKWRITQKCPPLLAIFVPLWVLGRILKSPVRPLSMLRSAKKRAEIYDALQLFVEEKNV